MDRIGNPLFVTVVARQPVRLIVSPENVDLCSTGQRKRGTRTANWARACNDVLVLECEFATHTE